MILDFELFKQAVRILKNDSLNLTMDSLSSLQEYSLLCEHKYETEMDELRRFIVYYKKFENQMNYRIGNIEQNDIQSWVPILKKQQSTTVFKDIKSTMISQITDARGEVEAIFFSLQEMKNRLMEQAKKTKLSFNSVQKAKTQLFLLQTATEMESYFSANGYQVKEFADYELYKYYQIFVGR